VTQAIPGVIDAQGTSVLVYVGFTAIILFLVALDLGVLRRRNTAPSFKQALAWSGWSVALGLSFTIVVYYLYEHGIGGLGIAPGNPGGKTAALQYLAGYVLEESLSLDNLFVIAVIFNYFSVPLQYQHRVLFWGVLGALVFRGIFIGAGAAVLSAFAWTTDLLGALLLITALRMLFVKHDDVDPEKNVFVRLVRRIYPVTGSFEEARFFSKINGRNAVTPLFLVLVLVESTDLLFAIDSVPAIFAVTSDPFLVYTSNVFAIIALRSMYFALAPSLKQIRYLNASLAVVLAFIGAKMILARWWHIPIGHSLGIIVSVIALGILASLFRNRGESPTT
jgi:tellurite resistance protein TerC